MNLPAKPAKHLLQNSALPAWELDRSLYNFNSLKQCLCLKSGMGYLQCSQIFKVRRKRTLRKYFTRCLEMWTGQCGCWEKGKEVSQLSTSFSYLASAPFIYCSSLLDNFCCNYSFSLFYFFVPIWHLFFSQPLIFSCNPMLSCSVWKLTLVWALSSLSAVYQLSKAIVAPAHLPCLIPLLKCYSSVKRWQGEAQWLLIPLQLIVWHSGSQSAL